MNAFPLQGMPPMPLGMGPNIVMPSLQTNLPPPGLVMPQNFSSMGQMGQIPLGPMGGFPAGMKAPGLPGTMMQSPPTFGSSNVRDRIKHIIKDKANFMQANPDSTKRLLSDPLKFLIE